MKLEQNLSLFFFGGFCTGPGSSNANLAFLSRGIQTAVHRAWIHVLSGSFNHGITQGQSHLHWQPSNTRKAKPGPGNHEHDNCGGGWWGRQAGLKKPDEFLDQPGSGGLEKPQPVEGSQEHGSALVEMSMKSDKTPLDLRSGISFGRRYTPFLRFAGGSRLIKHNIN